MNNPADPCTDFTDCGQTATVSSTNESGGWTHKIRNTIGTDATLYQLKTTRDFSCTFGWARSSNISKYVSNKGDVSACGSNSANPSSSVNENCTVFKRTPYYIDRTQGIALYKEQEEKLSFAVGSNETAIFRQMMGNMAFHKLKIRKSVKATGTERFILDNKGAKKTLVEKSYSFSPFPEQSPQNVWGLNGARVSQEGKYGTPDPDVAMILCLPIPGSLGIPLDKDIAQYGFYDYLEVEGGGGFSALMEKDGGQDFFYPEWCRNMINDPIWAETAAQRFWLQFPGAGVPKPATTPSAPWNPPSPETYCWPFGSFTKDALENFIYSCLLEFSPKSQGGKKLVHYSSFGDLKQAIFMDNILPINTNWIITPTSPL
jgi:hypothetical protein